MKPDRDFLARRRRRALATGLVLAGLCILFYFITIARIGQSSAI